MGSESKVHPNKQFDSPKKWVGDRISDLSSLGWNFESGGSSKLVAYQDSQTAGLLDQWARDRSDVEISIVIVSPNTEVSTLPIRALGYIATTLTYAKGLREKAGVRVNSLRLISPCHVNVFCDSGDLSQQLANTIKIQNLIQGYKDAYFPSLSDMGVTLDTGKEVKQDTVNSLKPRVDRIKKDYPEITQELLAVSRKYDLNGHLQHQLSPDLLPLVYLSAHPEAWGYSAEDLLFAQNGQRRINFTPASELRYLYDMTVVQSTWERSLDKQIATVISAKQTLAPYYIIWEGIRDNKGKLIAEPTLGDLSQDLGQGQVIANALRPLSGRFEVAEITDNLNQIRSNIQQAAGERKLNRQAPPPTINQLLFSIL